jgi:hypothetical protein
MNQVFDAVPLLEVTPISAGEMTVARNHLPTETPEVIMMGRNVVRILDAKRPQTWRRWPPANSHTNRRRTK